MKRFFLLSLLLSLVLFSCKKDPVVDNQDVVPITFMFHDTVDFAVPSVIGINLEWLLPSIDVSTGFQEEVGDLNPLVASVEDIHLKSMDLEVISPNGLEFDWMKNITLYMDALGKPRIELAHKFNILDSEGGRISLVSADNKLDDYVRSDTYQLDAELTIDQLLLQDITLRAYMSFEVDLINY